MASIRFPVPTSIPPPSVERIQKSLVKTDEETEIDDQPQSKTNTLKIVTIVLIVLVVIMLLVIGFYFRDQRRNEQVHHTHPHEHPPPQPTRKGPAVSEKKAPAMEKKLPTIQEESVQEPEPEPELSDQELTNIIDTQSKTIQDHEKITEVESDSDETPLTQNFDMSELPKLVDMDEQDNLIEPEMGGSEESDMVKVESTKDMLNKFESRLGISE